MAKQGSSIAFGLHFFLGFNISLWLKGSFNISNLAGILSLAFCHDKLELYFDFIACKSTHFLFTNIHLKEKM